MRCEWFALCPNETSKVTMHPHLGPVPICDRCADRMEITPEQLTEDHLLGDGA